MTAQHTPCSKMQRYDFVDVVRVSITQLNSTQRNPIKASEKLNTMSKRQRDSETCQQVVPSRPVTVRIGCGPGARQQAWRRVLCGCRTRH